MRKSNYRLAVFLVAGAISAVALDAKAKHQKPSPQDQIVVEAHLPVTAGPITRFIATRHYDRWYVYAEREAGMPVTLIDITNAAHPRVLSEVAVGAASGELLAVAGTAALAGGVSPAKLPAPQTVSLMDFSDPTQPKVTKQFEGVTAIEKIAGGSVILLADKDGIWILKQRFAEDPAAEERYGREVVYGQSMY
jgi:hypothetical protein